MAVSPPASKQGKTVTAPKPIDAGTPKGKKPTSGGVAQAVVRPANPANNSNKF
jgi:hypothetical protein